MFEKRDPSRVTAVTVLLFCILLGLFYAFRTSFFEKMILSEDSCTYVLLAKSILEGQGLASLWVVGVPEHAKAPFGYPLFLAPFVAWRGIDPGVLTYAMTAMTAAAFFAIFLFFRKLENSVLALAVVIMTALSGSVYLYGRSILSEIPYLFWSVLALWAVIKWNDNRNATSKIVCLALTLLMAFFTRTAGLLLVAAMVLSWYCESSREDKFTVILKRHAVLLVLVLIPISWWLVRQVWLAHTTNVSYVKDFIGGNYNETFSWLGFGMRVLKGAYAFVFYAIPKVLTNIEVHSRFYGMALLSAFSLGGLWWCLVTKRRVVDIYVFLYLVFACAWPWMQVSGVRYTVPLVPFLFYYWYVGVRELTTCAVKDKAVHVLRWLLIGAMLWVFISHSPVLFPRVSSSGLWVDPVPVTYEWIKKHTPAEAVFVSWTPISLYLYTGRRSADFASSTFNVQEFERLLESGQVKYVFSDMGMEQALTILAPVYLRHYGKFHRVYSEGRHKVYRVGRR